MKNKFNPLDLVKQLSALGERQGRTAIMAVEIIKNTLDEYGIIYSVEVSRSFIPKTNSASLIVDGRNVPCLSTAFKSGFVSGKENLVSSLVTSRFLIDQENINFNPLCDGVSRSSFYFSPSVAIDRKDLPTILKAKNVLARVSVKKEAIQNEQIIVGTTKNPNTIVFAHYDSIGVGATDNASGVSVAMGAIINNPALLKETLFVFDGNEELSFDSPTYWGKGFRDFEKKHKEMLESCKRIVVVDCVGNGKTTFKKDKEISYLAFPVKNIDKWSHKIFNLCGDIDKLMQVYHSDLDTPEMLSRISLNSAVELLSENL